MKSYNHLMEIYLTESNYNTALDNACCNKTGKNRKRVQARHYKEHRDRLMPELMYFAEHYTNAQHKPITIYDGISRKQRIIIVPTMAEQIAHHMVINVLKPIFMRSMYEHSYGSIPGRGAHLGKKYIEKWIRKNNRKAKYCLKMDIKKYFNSIPHAILKAKLAKIIHDTRFLHILNTIIDVSPDGKGIPIGFYTSQWFANWYLNDLDHYIKEVLKADCYVRYVDDMVVFGSNKRKVHAIRKAIDIYLNERLGLQMKENWQVFRFDYVTNDGKRIGRDPDFMGFRFFRDRTILRKRLMIKMCRKARRLWRKDRITIYDCRQMLSYLGWLKCTDTYAMYLEYIRPYVNFRVLRQYAGAYQRRINLWNCGENQRIVLT